MFRLSRISAPRATLAAFLLVTVAIAGYGAFAVPASPDAFVAASDASFDLMDLVRFCLGSGSVQ